MLQKGASASAIPAQVLRPLHRCCFNVSRSCDIHKSDYLYIAAINKAGVAQGYASSTLSLITAKILATSHRQRLSGAIFKEQQALYQNRFR